jgi:hypothetical protein
VSWPLEARGPNKALELTGKKLALFASSSLLTLASIKLSHEHPNTRRRNAAGA